jgi:hypothetical protein
MVIKYYLASMYRAGFRRIIYFSRKYVVLHYHCADLSNTNPVVLVSVMFYFRYCLFSSPFSFQLFLCYLYFLERNIKLVALVSLHCLHFCFNETLEHVFTNCGKRTITGTSTIIHSS